MQKIFSFLLILISTFSFSQDSRIDFKEISKSVNDSTSKYFYERLVYKFVYLPSSLDSLEVQHLYYGQLGQKRENSDSIKGISGSFFEKFREKQYNEAIPLGEKLIKNDPVNLEILGLLVQCYMNADKENNSLPLRGIQFQMLLSAIFQTKSETKNHTTFSVMSVTDEYIIAGVEGINLSFYRRRTEHSQNGIYDHWKKGKKRVSFHVIYRY